MTSCSYLLYCLGVFLCLTFVFKKDVLRLYKQRFKTETDPQPSTSAAQRQKESSLETQAGPGHSPSLEFQVESGE